MSGNIEEEIKALESTLCRLKDLQKQQCAAATQVVRKWEPVGGDWFINQCDDAVEKWDMSTEETKQAGLERPTQQQADRAFIEMRKFNRLLALRDELCGDDVVDWSRDDKAKYFLCCNEESKTWDININFRQNNNAVYFTKEEHAQRACDMLNSGEVIL
jgi:hypothetical protein